MWMSKDQSQMFLRISFHNWNIVQQYYRMNCLCGLSTKNKLLSLLCWVRVEANFSLEWPFISSRSLFRLVAALPGLAVENSNVSSATNLYLHQRLSDKPFMYIRKKSKSSIESWVKPALMLAQDVHWSLKVHHIC